MRRKIVLASGVFDLLHYGHIRYLEEAKKLGGESAKLVVIVARDKTVERGKGRGPIMTEDQRRALVESLEVVDEAILGYEEFNIDEVIKRVKPDIIAVGHDQHDIKKRLEEAIAKRGYEVKVVKIGKFGEEELDSSSKIKRKIIERWEGV